MSISSKSLGPACFSDRLRNSKRRSRKETAMGFALTLTPLIDCFSILVIFLLNQLAVDPTATQTAQVSFLPKASQVQSLEPAPFISLQKDGVFVGETRIASFRETRKNWGILKPELIKLAPSSDPRRITLQADAELPSEQITELLSGLASIGYTSVQLAVSTEKRSAD